MEAKYFVGSHSEYPIKIFFNSEFAFASGLIYIDVFDENGEPLESFKKNGMLHHDLLQLHHPDYDYETEKLFPLTI